jgi:hypothetical protein
VFDRSLVTPGFDVEVLVSEAYLDYLILSQIEAGLLPFEFDSVDATTGDQYHVTLHPPEAARYVRRYPPHPDAVIPNDVTGSVACRLLADGEPSHMLVLVYATVRNVTTGVVTTEAPSNLAFNLDVKPGQTSAAGFESGHVLQLDFVGFDAPTKGVLESRGVNVAPIEAEIRRQVPDDISLGVAQGQQVHQIRMRRFVTATQRSIGLYVNLALKSSPDEFVPARGDIDDAQDFRPGDAPIAFATSPSLFGLLGPDAFAGQAERNEAGDGWRYPMREDPFDSESDEIGRIKGISVGPELIPTTPVPSGRLVIDIHGEYTDAPGDPDFHLQLFFRPTRDAEGIVTWDPDVDVDLGLLATIVLVAAGIGLTLLFGPGGLGSSLMIGSMLGLAVLKGLIAEPIATRIVSDRLDAEAQASVLDVVPFQIPGARRRWDPFYRTEHLVVALLDEDVVVDHAGIAFVGASLALDKKPVPVEDVVIRDEDRHVGTLSGLRYRINDYRALTEADLNRFAPGTDRLSYVAPQPLETPPLLSLTLAEIADRIATKRILAPLVYTPERINMFEHQIDLILAISSRERAELADQVERTFRNQMRSLIFAQFGATIRAQREAELTQSLGRPPTAQELNAAVDAHVNRIVDGLMTDFRRDLMPDLLDAAVARALRFDLRPDELIELQQAGALTLEGVEILVRHNADGTETPYYRDHPDADPRDNLLALRTYTAPYQPPP